MSYIPNETEHKHSKSHVVDDTVLFKVDPITRQIIKVDENDVVLVKNDHNSERYRISMPRYIDGHDMSLCDTARVHYINTGTTSGVVSSDVYESDDLGLVIEEGMTEADATEISFTWLVANTATQEHGRLAFAIELCCTGDNTLDGYAWHSGVYADITVSDGIHNGKAIVGVYGDILQSWWEKLFVDMGGVVEENSKNRFRFWLGTQEEYNAIKPEDIIPDCVYFIKDEAIFDDFQKRLDEVYPHIDDKTNPHGVTAAQVGAYSKDETYNKDEVDTHTNNKDNPHGVTAAQAGAYSKDETYNKDEINSVAQTAEDNAKSYADSVAQTAEDNATTYTEDRLGDIGTDNTVESYVDTHTNNKDNPHGVTAAQVGAYSKDETYSKDEVNSKVSSATTYAYDIANIAESNAKVYAEEKASAARDHATEIANIAESNAKSYAVPKFSWSESGADYRVYAQNNVDGSETALWASDTNTSWGFIPRRSTGGNIIVPGTPTESNHAASKGYVDSKVGDFSFIDLETGQITVPETPTNNTHAASKKYVGDRTRSLRNDVAKQYTSCRLVTAIGASDLNPSNADNTEDIYNEYTLYTGFLDTMKLYEVWVSNTVIPFEVSLPFEMNKESAVMKPLLSAINVQDVGKQRGFEVFEIRLSSEYAASQYVYTVKLRHYEQFFGADKASRPTSLFNQTNIYIYSRSVLRGG